MNKDTKDFLITTGSFFLLWNVLKKLFKEKFYYKCPRCNYPVDNKIKICQCPNCGQPLNWESA